MAALWSFRSATITFTDETPTEFIAAFLTDLTASEPLDPERDQHT